MSFFFFLATLGVGAAMLVTAVRKSLSRTEAAWVDTAARLNLAYHKKKALGGRRKIEGDYHGFHVKVNTFSKSHGNGGSTFTRYTLFMPSLDLGLELTQQHFLAGLANSFTGAKDLTVGDEDFDKAVIVHSTSPIATQKFLTAQRRLVIRKFLTGNRRARITDDEVSYIHNGVVNDEGRLKAGLDTLVHLAQSFGTRAEPAATYTARPMDEVREEVRRESKPEPRLAMGSSARDLEAQAAALFLGREPIQQEVQEEAPPLEAISSTPPLGETPVEPEPAAAAAAFEVTEPSGEPANEPSREPAAEPTDRLVLEPASQPPVEPIEEAPTASDQVPESTDSGPDSVDYTGLRAELFESGMMSSESKDAFEQKFAGHPIAWSGKLRRIARYSSDFTFEGSGAKAVVELEGVADGSFTKGVQAIVQLPESAADDFGGAYDVPVTFTGILHSCDGFLRDILVTDGEMKRAD